MYDHVCRYTGNVYINMHIYMFKMAKLYQICFDPKLFMASRAIDTVTTV